MGEMITRKLLGNAERTDWSRQFVTLMILAVNKSADEVKEPLSVDEYRVFFYFIHAQ